MKLHKLARFGILIFFPLVTFQNCSQIAPQDLQSSGADQKVSGAGAVDPTIGGQGSGQVDMPGDVTDTGGNQTPPVVPTVPVADDDSDHHEQGHHDDGSVCTNHGHDDSHDSDHEMEDHDDGDHLEVADNDDDMDESEDVISDVAACMNFKADRAITGSSFVDLKGRHDIASDQIDLIQGGSGKLVINAISTSARGKLTLLDSRHGKMVICNMEVGEISNTHGAIRLINSHVKMISGHKGNVKGYNSTVDATEGVRKIKISSN